LFVTYIVVRLALQAVLDECNRMAAEAGTQEQAAILKSRIAQLEMDFAKGAIDEETYTSKAAEILGGLRPSGDPGLQMDGGGRGV
jgi:uncharacterized membrane protein